MGQNWYDREVHKSEKTKFIGNGGIIEMLGNAVMHGGGHAYLLHGPEHLGKRTVSEMLARDILDTENLSTHPDILIIEPDKEKAHPIITVEQARTVRKFLSLTPSVSKRKVVILDGAELMNSSSANALLKVLEEPAGDAVIFLITHSVGAILPTIRSRSMPVRFALVHENEIARNVKDEEAVRICDGKPGLAILFSRDHERLMSLKRRRDAIIQLLGAPAITRLAYMARAQDVAKDAIRELPKQWLPVLRTYMYDTSEAKVACGLVRSLFNVEDKLRRTALRPELLLEEALLAI